MWLKATNIKCSHGFSTRHGGVSSGAFKSLNLGGSEDEKLNIDHNRKLALDKLDLGQSALFTLRQVHGNTVCRPTSHPQEGDALVSNTKNEILAVSIADCYPLLFFDEVAGVIGAAHAGWRGTCAKIAATTISEMVKLGASSENINVAIGQGISQDKFEVGEEVIGQFEKAGFKSNCWKGRNIDLIEANKQVLSENNIPAKNIWALNRCTFEPDFFSYRRDGGKTGRMWGLICMQ